MRRALLKANRVLDCERVTVALDQNKRCSAFRGLLMSSPNMGHRNLTVGTVAQTIPEGQLKRLFTVSQTLLDGVPWSWLPP